MICKISIDDSDGRGIQTLIEGVEGIDAQTMDGKLNMEFLSKVKPAQRFAFIAMGILHQHADVIGGMMSALKRMDNGEDAVEPPGDSGPVGGIKYPCRCRIVDPEGEKVFESDTHDGIAMANPSVAAPKVGRLGWAHREGPTVRIKLDDGSELMGYECWWEPIADVN